MVSLVANVAHEQKEFVQVQHGFKLEMEDSGGAVQDYTLSLLRKSGVGPHPQHFLVELAWMRGMVHLPPKVFYFGFCHQGCWSRSSLGALC